MMADDSAMSVLSRLESHIIPLVPGLREALERGIRVLDAGCGRGRILNRLAQLFPRSRFQGRDLSDDAMSLAYASARALNLTNVQFVVDDLRYFHRTSTPHAFDLVTTFDAVHDQTKSLLVLRGIRRTLTRDGFYLMGEGLDMMWGEERTCQCLKAAGFTSIDMHRLEHDLQSNWYVVQ
jgi:cyclopropane fatty-acyl-phospholipid synthase-like methyltransferase